MAVTDFLNVASTLSFVMTLTTFSYGYENTKSYNDFSQGFSDIPHDLIRYDYPYQDIQEVDGLKDEGNHFGTRTENHYGEYEDASLNTRQAFDAFSDGMFSTIL